MLKTQALEREQSSNSSSNSAECDTEHNEEYVQYETPFNYNRNHENVWHEPRYWNKTLSPFVKHCPGFKTVKISGSLLSVLTEFINDIIIIKQQSLEG